MDIGSLRQVALEVVERLGEALQPRSSVEISENSKAEPSVKVKAYSGDCDGMRHVTDTALAEYKHARQGVMQP